MILRAPATLPDLGDDESDEDLDDEDDYYDENGPARIYNDRTVEVNGEQWFIFDGVVLPAENA